jgi:hypothetical protein
MIECVLAHSGKEQYRSHNFMRPEYGKSSSSCIPLAAVLACRAVVAWLYPGEWTIMGKDRTIGKNQSVGSLRMLA